MSKSTNALFIIFELQSSEIETKIKSKKSGRHLFNARNVIQFLCWRCSCHLQMRFKIRKWRRNVSLRYSKYRISPGRSVKDETQRDGFDLFRTNSSLLIFIPIRVRGFEQRSDPQRAFQWTLPFCSLCDFSIKMNKNMKR